MYLRPLRLEAAGTCSHSTPAVRSVLLPFRQDRGMRKKIIGKIPIDHHWFLMFLVAGEDEFNFSLK
jgi:hypothetical protein